MLTTKIVTEPDKFKTLSPAQWKTMVEILGEFSGNIEVQLHTTPSTKLGHRDDPRSSIVKDLEIDANKRRAPEKQIEFVHVPMTEEVTRRAVSDVQARDAIGAPSARLKKLSGATADEGSLAHRQAQSMLLAEGRFTKGLASYVGPGLFVDEYATLFDVLVPETCGGPALDNLAADIVKRLKAPPRLGTKGPRKVIIDLSQFDSAGRREVLRLLKDAIPESRRKNLLIHDRDSGQIGAFNPEGIK